MRVWNIDEQLLKGWWGKSGNEESWGVPNYGVRHLIKPVNAEDQGLPFFVWSLFHHCTIDTSICTNLLNTTFFCIASFWLSSKMSRPTCLDPKPAFFQVSNNRSLIFLYLRKESDGIIRGASGLGIWQLMFVGWLCLLCEYLDLQFFNFEVWFRSCVLLFFSGQP